MAAVTAPPPLPVTLDELKAFLRIEGSDDDAVLAALLRSAADTCEAFTGQALIAREVTETVAATQGWTCLGVVPVRAIDAVTAIAEDAITITLGTDGYAIDIDAEDHGWVRVLQPVQRGLVRVRYTAGMAGDANGVPEPLRQGILRLAAHSYGARGEAEAPPPASVAALWRPRRRMRLR